MVPVAGAVLVLRPTHAMLRRAADWYGLTARLVADLLGLGGLPQQVEEAMRLGRGEIRGLHVAVPPGARYPG